MNFHHPTHKIPHANPLNAYFPGGFEKNCPRNSTEIMLSIVLGFMLKHICIVLTDYALA